LIAYSSVAHIGPVLASILSFVWLGWVGAFFIIIAHGICSSGLFFALNLSYEQFKSRRALLIKRIRIFNPILIFWWFFLCCSNMSCPPTMNFISELLIIIPILIVRSPYAFLFLAVLLIISGVYSVYLFININHGEYLFKYFFSIIRIRDLLRFFIHRIPLILFVIFIQYLY
jgi:NADH-ubiquinone oxidoreductase chain 4